MLTDRTWKLKYTPDDGDSGTNLFYEPVLQDAVRYDRLTGAAAPSVGGTPRAPPPLALWLERFGSR